MIEFTFAHTSIGSWTITINLTKDMTGGQAFEAAAAEYKAMFPGWYPGHPDVVITMRGK